MRCFIRGFLIRRGGGGLREGAVGCGFGLGSVGGGEVY